MKQPDPAPSERRLTGAGSQRFGGRTIIAGIGGGIAAYKAADLVSQLRQQGAQVQVVMTHAACQFVSPLTFAALAHRPVLSDLFRDQPLSHVELAHRADLIVVVPATYDLIGKVAHGLADDYLTTLIAASRAPVLFVPAMESQMYENPIFQANKRALAALGYRFLAAERGPLASGREGVGRLPRLETILASLASMLRERAPLADWKIMVTAGPTRERLDPMRCLTNRSSGRMGYALAQAAERWGAQVLLISGPTTLEPPPGVELVRIESAAELKEVVLNRAPEQDAILMAAAVADWRPAHSHRSKVAKSDDQEKLELTLERTPDILKALGAAKRANQLLIGFAAETDELEAKARAKLAAKNLDLIVANELTRQDAGPEAETNIAMLIYRDGKTEKLPLLSKLTLAREILRRLMNLRSIPPRST